MYIQRIQDVRMCKGSAQADAAVREIVAALPARIAAVHSSRLNAAVPWG